MENMTFFPLRVCIFCLEAIKMFVKHDIDFQVMYKQVQGGMVPTDVSMLDKLRKRSLPALHPWECFL